MIDKIEFLESLMNKQSSQIILDGMACIHMCIEIAATGNEDLRNVINGR